MENPSAGQALLEQLWQFQQQGLFCDTEIQTQDGTVLGAHANVLAARSPLLKNLLLGKKGCKIRFVLKQSLAVLTDVLQIIYTNSLDKNRCINDKTSTVLNNLLVSHHIAVGKSLAQTEANDKAELTFDTDNDHNNHISTDMEYNGDLESVQSFDAADKVQVDVDQACQVSVSDQHDGTAEDEESEQSSPSIYTSAPSLTHDHTYSKLCEFCGFKINTKDEHKWHKLHKCLGDKAADGDQFTFKCHVCSHVITDENKEHLKKHMDEHQLLSSAKFKCSKCYKIFCSDLGLSRHIANCDGARKWSTCTCCGKHFTSSYRLGRHNEKIHNLRGTGTKNREQCSNCEKIFDDEHTLQDHKKTHKDPQQFTCTECKVNFSRRLHFLKHRADQHKDGFKCGICLKYFALAVRRNRHVKSVHIGEKAHICNFCGMGFSESTLLKRHINTRHSEAKPHKCTLCPARFKRKDNLKYHLKTCHYETDAKYKCSFCDRIYKSELNKRQHEYDHTGIKCQICGDIFYSYKNYIVHRSEIHNDVSVRRQSIKTKTCEKKFECSYCNEAFCSLYRKYRHQKTHTVFTCKLCGSFFGKVSLYQKHRRQEHRHFRSTKLKPPPKPPLFFSVHGGELLKTQLFQAKHQGPNPNASPQ